MSCHESFCVPGSTPCSLPKISTRPFLECCDRKNLVHFLLCWILGRVHWDFIGEVQTQLGLGSLGQDCFRRWTIRLSVLKQRSKCPVGECPEIPTELKKSLFPFPWTLCNDFHHQGRNVWILSHGGNIRNLLDKEKPGGFWLGNPF